MKVEENEYLGMLGQLFVYDCEFEPKGFMYVNSDMFDGMYLAAYQFTENEKEYMLVVNYEEKTDELVLTIQDDNNILFSNFTTLSKFTTRTTENVIRAIPSDEETIKECKEMGWVEYIDFLNRGGK